MEAGISIFGEDVYNTEYIIVVLFLSFLFNFPIFHQGTLYIFASDRLNPCQTNLLKKTLHG